jgi:hypothetical protein
MQPFHEALIYSSGQHTVFLLRRDILLTPLLVIAAYRLSFSCAARVVGVAAFLGAE